jgi:hypothetical protein
MRSTGSILGSVLGGRFSDHELARHTAVNGGKTYAEVKHSRFCSKALRLLFFQAAFEK